MKKRILFVCMHNLFRSQVAEIYFNKLNKNKNYSAKSAGLIKWDKGALNGDSNYQLEKRISLENGIKLKEKSNGLNYNLLKETDIVIITADDVPKEIFKEEKSFSGEVLVWKTKDVKENEKNKEKLVIETITSLKDHIKSLLNTLQ